MAPPLSAQDLHYLEREGGVEFVAGRLMEKSVSIASVEIGMTVACLLRGEAARTGAAHVFGPSMGYRCFPKDPHRCRKPDASVVRAERMTGINRREAFMPIPADLIVEVLSPKDGAYGVAQRVGEYLNGGFPLIWVVHPSTKSVTIHRAGGSISVLHVGDEITGEGALPSSWCKVAEFFTGP